MTPKEKAKELVDKFMPFSEANWHELAMLSELRESRLINAKECAMLAVDEVINSVVVTNLSVAENQFLFWEQVKQEINKL